jgi:chorismate-pyruvate lyase
MDGVVKETDPGQRWGDCFIRMSIECHRDNKARAAKEILARNSLMITKGKLVMVKEEG